MNWHELHLATSVWTLQTPRRNHCEVFLTILTNMSFTTLWSRRHTIEWTCVDYYKCCSTSAVKFICDKENDVFKSSTTTYLWVILLLSLTDSEVLELTISGYHNSVRMRILMLILHRHHFESSSWPTAESISTWIVQRPKPSSWPAAESMCTLHHCPVTLLQRSVMYVAKGDPQYWPAG